jgi:hypothetical protein
LYMRLFFHFANLFDGHHKDRLSFPKRYDDICREWLGGLTVHAYPSLIERDQLGPHLRELVRHGFLTSYSITKARSRDGLILTFRPGATFFADYDRFYRHRSQGDLQFDFHADQRQVAEPLKVAYLFAEKRTGKPLTLVSYVSSKDVETAKQLLRAVSFDQIREFLDYALAEARKTNFDVQTLGGLRQYVAGYVHVRKAKHAARGAAEQRTEQSRRETAQRAYDQFWAAEADALLGSLPANERTEIEGRARAKNSSTALRPGSLSDTIHRIACRRIAAERHPERIPTFEEWSAAQNRA